MELTIHPWRLSQPSIAQKYEALLVNFPNLAIRDIDRTVARRAAQLRGEYNLRTADALQAAASLVNGAGAFITNDRRLDAIKTLLPVVILEDYLG
jgi:predicted nucleic acid-binding protein